MLVKAAQSDRSPRGNITVRAHTRAIDACLLNKNGVKLLYSGFEACCDAKHNLKS